MSAKLRLDHVSLFVRNLAVSAKFYQETFQLPEIECLVRKSHIRWFGIGDAQSLHLIEGDVGDTSVKMSTHFCISTDDFDRKLKHLEETGVFFCNLRQERGTVNLRADGIRQTYVKDPDGYWVELNDDWAA